MPTNSGTAGAPDTVKLDGIRELSRALKDSETGIADLKDANKNAAKIVQEFAASSVPVRTGALLASLRSGATKTAGVVRAGRKSVPYANPIHWGWFKRNIKPRFFISAPAKEAEPHWAEAYHQALETVIDKHLNGKTF